MSEPKNRVMKAEDNSRFVHFGISYEVIKLAGFSNEIDKILMF